MISNWALQTAEATRKHFLLSSCRKTISVLKCYGLAKLISLLVPLQQIVVLQRWPTSIVLSSTGTTAISKCLSMPRIFIILFQMVYKHTASRGTQSTRKHIPQEQSKETIKSTLIGAEDSFLGSSSGLEHNTLEVASITTAFKRKFNTSFLKLTFL